MYQLATLFVVLTTPALAQDVGEDDVEDDVIEVPKDFEGYDVKISKGLQGDTVRGGGTALGARPSRKVVTEDGAEITFIDLDPKEESSLPPAWVVAAMVGGAMLVLGLLASIFIWRASASDEPDTP